jgi:hypothetical protein
MSKVNLKKISEQKDALVFINRKMKSDPEMRRFNKKIVELTRFLEDIESDLELSGECIIELDMPRMEAIEERNKRMNVLPDDVD